MIDFECQRCVLWVREEPEDRNGTCHYDPNMVLAHEYDWCWLGLKITQDISTLTPGDAA